MFDGDGVSNTVGLTGWGLTPDHFPWTWQSLYGLGTTIWTCIWEQSSDARWTDAWEPWLNPPEGPVSSCWFVMWFYKTTRGGQDNMAFALDSWGDELAFFGIWPNFYRDRTIKIAGLDSWYSWMFPAKAARAQFSWTTGLGIWRGTCVYGLVYGQFS